MAISQVTAPRSRPRGHGRAARRRSRSAASGELTPSMSHDRPLDAPAIVTVFHQLDGRIYHARCRRQIEFCGTRGGLELDFYCLSCREHVTLPEHVLARIPVGPLP